MNLKAFKYVLSIGFLALLLPMVVWASPASTLSGAPTVLRIACQESTDNPILGRPLTDLIETFKAVNVDMQVVYVPPAESVQALRDKKFDGSCARQKSFSSLSGMDFLVRPETPLFSIQYVAVTRKGELVPQDLTGVKVGYQGSHVAIGKFLNTSKSRGYGSLHNLFSALKSKSIDVVVVLEASFYRYQEAVPVGWLEVQNVIFSTPVYLHLMDKHKALIDFFDRRYPYLRAQKNTTKESYQEPLLDLSDNPKDKTINFTCSVPPEYSLATHFLTVSRQVFADLGYNFRMHYSSRMRALGELKNGSADGFCASSNQVDSDKQWQVHIDVPIFTSSIQVLSMNNHRVVASAADFKSHDRVGFLSGSLHIESALAKGPAHLLSITTFEKGLEMLATDKIDYLVEYSLAVTGQLRNVLLQKPLYSVGLIEQVTFYPSLHPRHKEQAPLIEKKYKEYWAPFKL
jgi:ABC-type amino acid transport substrate-binding protein